MTEIYWLQRLGNISIVFQVGLAACVVVVGVIFIFYFMAWSTEDFEEDFMSKTKQSLKKSAYALAFFTLGAVLMPTQKELLAIYGLGGTIDYIKSNDKAKQLPDKCIDALTRYVDSIEKENKKDGDNQDSK